MEEVPFRVKGAHGIVPRPQAEKEREVHVGDLKALRSKIEDALKGKRLFCFASEYLAVVGCLEYVFRETG